MEVVAVVVVVVAMAAAAEEEEAVMVAETLVLGMVGEAEAVAVVGVTEGEVEAVGAVDMGRKDWTD